MRFALRKFIVGYDTFERHRVAARLVSKKSAQILDVGGGDNLLQQFIDLPVVSVNLDHGNIFANGLFLPFQNNSFDSVTCLDVIEHVPVEQRRPFIKELIRIGRSQVILSAPYGSQEHIASERALLDRMHHQGIVNKMLEEHVKNGLPTFESIVSYIPEAINVKAAFSGFYQFNRFCVQTDNLFKSDELKVVRAMLALFLNLLGNLIIVPLSYSKSPSVNTNRMFFLLSK